MNEKWLHLPWRQVWINGQRIEAINGWHEENDPSVIVSYTISLAGHDDDDYMDIEHPDDVAAVTAWLEGRS